MTRRIAIVGGGVSGLTAAHFLHPSFDITIFEAAPQVGGHVNTVDVTVDGSTWAVDTGFIVYNEKNYPNFTKLLAQLEVATKPSTMSFSVSRRDPDFEYNGSTFRQLFAQRRNLLRPSFYRMLLDIVRFNRTAPSALDDASVERPTLAALVQDGGYSDAFVYDYLVPMGSAIWSTPADAVLDMDANFFVTFFQNHGMLTIDDRPEWRVIRGGSREYVRKLVQPFREKIRTNKPVHRVARDASGVTVDGERFDQVILACHSHQSLDMLERPTDVERNVLDAIPFQNNEIVLHTDTNVLPRRRSAWAAWNYHLSNASREPVGVTYNMNILQGLDAPKPICVTLNDHDAIASETVLYKTTFAHPQFTQTAVTAKKQIGNISGQNRTHYCGAYWGNGFHEDGVSSAIAVARSLGIAA